MTNENRLTLIIPVLEMAGVDPDCTPSLSHLELAPEGVVLCSGALGLAQDDIDTGRMISEAFARGEARDGQTVLAESIAEKKIEQIVELSVGGTDRYEKKQFKRPYRSGEHIQPHRLVLAWQSCHACGLVALSVEHE